MSDLQWTALVTQPTHRVEFHVLHRVTQHEYPAMLPFEVVYEKRHGKRLPVKRKYSLFPRYVFVGLRNIADDFDRLRRSIPEIQGIVSRTRGAWSPLILSPDDVAFIARLVDGCAGMTEVDLHKALKPGKLVEIDVGGTTQTTKIDSLTKKGVKVMLEMLGSFHSVEVKFDKVRAA